jgi:hypothetical protein
MRHIREYHNARLGDKLPDGTPNPDYGRTAPPGKPDPSIDDPSPTSLPLMLRFKFEESLREGESLPTIPAVDPDEIFENGEPEDGEPEDGEPETGEPESVPEVPNDAIPEEETFQKFGRVRIPHMPVGNSTPFTIPELDIGRTFLMPPQADGQRFRAKILERVDKYKKDLDKERNENAQYKVLVGHNEGERWEEVVAYNDLAQFIDETDNEDGQWKFRSIVGHQGPLKPTEEDYKGSRWNVLVAWETGEVTKEPLSVVQHE